MATTVKAEDVRIPRPVREAVARHEDVVVVNRERPAFVIVHPDEHRRGGNDRRGRRVSDALARLGEAGLPDPAFAQDMTAVLDAVGSGPTDPWASS
jgi:hypothetical protein